MKQIQMNILIDKKDLDILRKVSSKRGQRYSDYVRFIIKKELSELGLLDKKSVKFLGLAHNE